MQTPAFVLQEAAARWISSHVVPRRRFFDANAWVTGVPFALFCSAADSALRTQVPMHAVDPGSCGADLLRASRLGRAKLLVRSRAGLGRCTVLETTQVQQATSVVRRRDNHCESCVSADEQEGWRVFGPAVSPQNSHGVRFERVLGKRRTGETGSQTNVVDGHRSGVVWAAEALPACSLIPQRLFQNNDPGGRTMAGWSANANGTGKPPPVRRVVGCDQVVGSETTRNDRSN